MLIGFIVLAFFAGFGEGSHSVGTSKSLWSGRRSPLEDQISTASPVTLEIGNSMENRP
jgi:hypothetical protein